MKLLDTARTWAARIKRDGLTLWFSLRDARTPWLARALAWLVVAYALSPIDLIPDFIPVLGYLDDVLLLPGLIWLTVRLLPDAVLTDCRQQADAWVQARQGRPRSLFGAALVIALWGLVVWWAWSAWEQR
ncbi:MAG: hypothetical protein RLZZ373_684 [Pseudomonadota bacterium]|jgi:uncharacterized membrane protein YkvA (DUF1232 family)